MLRTIQDIDCLIRLACEAAVATLDLSPRQVPPEQQEAYEAGWRDALAAATEHALLFIDSASRQLALNPHFFTPYLSQARAEVEAANLERKV